MTLLWIVLTAMTSVAAVLVAAPFLRRLDERRSSAERELEVYRDQLGEVEREAAGGFIDGGQAQAASNEIKRRLLAADRAATEAPRSQIAAPNNFVVITIAGFVVLGSTILYAVTGRPDLPSATPGIAPSQTAAVMRQEPPIPAQTQPQMLPRPQMQSQPQQTQPQGGGAAGLGSVDEMIERVLARVQKNPADAESWRMLGWSYAGTERYGQAAEAYAKAVALKPDNAELQASYREALARVNGAGTGGSAAGANETATAATGTQPAEFEPLKPIVPAPQSKGPAAADVRAAGAMTPEARQAMIRDMVDGLAGRLEKSPRDGDGWIQLIQARKVLGEMDAARAALEKALAAFTDIPQEQDRIRIAARALGVAE